MTVNILLNRSIYTMKSKKVKRNHNNMLAVSESLVYTKLTRIIFIIILSFFQLQYKIPLQIENEDVVMF